MASKDAPLADAVSIWKQVKKSGLAPTTYDKDFVAALSKKLGLQPNRSIERQLRHLKPSIVDFLGAFLSCSQPFDDMAQAIWSMFVQADARFSDENLQIVFDFSKRQPDGIKFDLEHFKAFHEEYVRFRQLVAKVPLTSDFLWGLRRLLGSWALPMSPDVARWTAAYDRGQWLMPLPQLAETGDSQIDLVLRETCKVVSTVAELLIARGARPHEGRDQYKSRAGSPDAGRAIDDELADVLSADHDRWLANMLIDLDQLAARLAADVTDPNARPSVDQIQKYLQDHFLYEEEEALGKQLEEFLNLPLWKQRDQLFGLWVATQIADAVGYDRLVFHPVNGGLRFRFAATHVATVTCEPRLYLYAELRTPARMLFGKGRKRGIQPDWRLVREPVTDKGSQVVIVECKQYAKPSRKNFLEAVIDYATNGGVAQVILVNYGDMDAARLLSNIPDRLTKPWRKVHDRVTLLGGFRPAEAEVRQRFYDLLISQVPVRTAKIADPPQISGYPANGAIVSLSWDDQAVDLDLHVVISLKGYPASRIFYGGPGSLTVEPWVELERDVQQGGQAPEVLRVTRWQDGKYEVWVHNYTGGNDLPPSTVLRVNFNGCAVELQPTKAPGRVWHVLDIDGATRGVSMINTMHPALPTS